MHALVAAPQMPDLPRREEFRGINALPGSPTLVHYVSALNVFRYITFRAAGASATALAIVAYFGPGIIAALRLKQGKGQPIRADGPQSPPRQEGHADHGRPDDPGRRRRLHHCSGPISKTAYVWIVLFVTLGFGAIGFYRRLSQGDQADPRRLFRPRAPRHRGGHRHARRLFHDVRLGRRAGGVVRRPAVGPGRALPCGGAGDQAGAALRQRLAGRSRLVLHSLRGAGHRRRRQCRQPHRRPRRPRHRAGDDRLGDLRRHRLSRRQFHLRPLSRHQPRHGRGRADGDGWAR